MAEITKEQLLEFIRNKDLDLDESYPRSDWWKFRDERDSYKKQRDELINDMAETKRKAKAWEELKDKLNEDYIEQIRHINQYSITDANDTWSSGWNMSAAQQLYTDLCLMDQLDRTNEFQNLLSDLEDE